MAFLDSFANRSGYRDADIYQFERRRDRPQGPSSFQYGDWQPNKGLQSRGMLDRVGNRAASPTSGNPTEGLLGIQNTTGFAQSAPNVVYDQGPEQFAQEMKLRNRELDIRGKTADAAIENNRILNESRMMNAGANQERALVARMRVENPNLIFQRIPGGNLVALDPSTGQVIDTGISSGAMSQEDAIELRQKGSIEQIGARNTGALEQIGARNTGALDLERLRQEGRMNVVDANNVAKLEQLGFSRESALQLEQARASNRMTLQEVIQAGLNSRQANDLTFQTNREIYKAGNDAWSNIVRNTNEPIPPQPAWPQKTDIPLEPNINVASGGAIASLGSMRPMSSHRPSGFNAKPNEFTAKPNEFTAAPGQYTAPVDGKNPVTGAPAGAPQADNVKPDPSNPGMSLVTFPDGKVRRVPNAEVPSVIESFSKMLVKGTEAGATGKTPAGTVTGKAAGQVR